MVVLEIDWKAAMTNKFMKVEIRRILALEFVCSLIFGRPWHVVRDVKEALCAQDTQRRKVVDDAFKAYEFRTT